MTVIGPSFDPDGPGYETARPPYGLEAGTIECPMCGIERSEWCETCGGCDCECVCGED